MSDSDKRHHTPARPVAVNDSDHVMSGALRDILVATAVLTIPLLLITALLFGLIFKNLVHHNPAQASVFQSVGNGDENGVYYVDFSATKLTTLASWSSSLAPILPGLLMTLLFFRLSSTVRSNSEALNVHRLPTPYQLNLILGMSSGGPLALWEWTKYMLWKRREKTVAVVRVSAALLICSLLLTYLIWAADTWLHVTTTTILFDQIIPSTSLNSFGRRLPPSCITQVSRIADSCNINPAGTATFLTGGSEGIQILSNTSRTNQISYTVLDGVQYSYIADTAAKQGTDFMASTFASHVSCTPISTECNLVAAYGASTPFKCSDAFAGDLTNANANHTSPLQRGIIEDFFFDQQLTQAISSLNVSSNPVYLAIGTIVNQNDNSGSAGGNLLDDPEIINPVHGGTAFILRCEVDVYDMKYVSMNGTVQSATFSPANSTVASLFLAPFLDTDFGDIYTENGLKVAGISNTSQQIADKFSVTFSQVVLGSTAGVLIPSRNLEEQQRTQFLVTRLPMAPLFTLTAANLLFVLVGLIMALVACLSGPRKNNSIRQWLTLRGIVASRFEADTAGQHLRDPSDFFVESTRPRDSSRVGMRSNGAGAWEYHTWGQDN